ncbi:MAG: hypothetical protein O2943_06095 [Actinomycetota bacterium]|nr:hypothetical protein [Actinomycetota bacterium]
MAIWIRGVGDSANLRYGRGSNPRLLVDELREIPALSSQMARVAFGGPDNSIGGTDLHLLTPFEDLMSPNDTVSNTLASVSFFGRFNNFWQQSMLLHNLGPASELEDA